MTDAPLTHPSPTPAGLSSVLENNIAWMHERRTRQEQEASLSERLSDRITRFAGSMTFVIIHAIAYSAEVGLDCIEARATGGLMPARQASTR